MLLLRKKEINVPLIRLLFSVILFSFPAFSIADQLTLYFYQVEVVLTDGEILNGSSWGIGHMGGLSLQESKIKKVDLGMF